MVSASHRYVQECFWSMKGGTLTCHVNGFLHHHYIGVTINRSTRRLRVIVPGIIGYNLLVYAGRLQAVVIFGSAGLGWGRVCRVWGVGCTDRQLVVWLKRVGSYSSSRPYVSIFFITTVESYIV